MKKSLLWILAFFITLGAAYYQRKTGPTYPLRVKTELNDSLYELKLIRSLGLDERPEVKLHISDTTVKALLFYKRFRTDDEYSSSQFIYKEYPVNSFVMNRIFNMTREKGMFAEVPQQPAAGKLQYYIGFTDSNGTKQILKDTPVVIRFKGAVPGKVLLPHILLMFLAMLFSTAAGLLAMAKLPSYKKYGMITLGLLFLGGMVLGPLVQKFAFGEFWTGIPFGWDLTDNKTLIAFLFWIAAAYMSFKKDKPLYTILASIVLLMVYSIPHSLFGSELDYDSGKVVQGIFLAILMKIKKKS